MYNMKLIAGAFLKDYHIVQGSMKTSKIFEYATLQSDGALPSNAIMLSEGTSTCTWSTLSSQSALQSPDDREKLICRIQT